MLATKNIYIQSAYNTLQVINQDEEKRMEYKAREKAFRDYNQGILEAEQHGAERGWEKGREEGEKAGIEKNQRDTACKMIAMGLPTSHGYYYSSHRIIYCANRIFSIAKCYTGVTK